MKPHNRKLLLDSEDAPRSTTSRSTTSTLQQPSDPHEFSTDTAITAKPLNQTLGFNSSMALTVLVLLSALFFMVFFSMYLRRFAGDHNSSMEISRRRRQQRRTTSSSSSSSSSTSSFSSIRKGLDPSTIKSLPLFAFERNSKEEEAIDCVVCLSEFEEKETVKMIPYCGHVFHQDCIDMWFDSHVSCPLCRSTRLFRSSSSSSSSSVKMKEEEEEEVVDIGSLDLRKRIDGEDQVVVVVVMSTDEVGSSVERTSSTVRNGDTCIEGGDQREASISRSSSNVRRSSSWSRLRDEKVIRLPRSSSF